MKQDKLKGKKNEPKKESFAEEVGYKTRFHCMADQVKQSREEKKHPGHYRANIIFALFGSKELFVDYRRISHKNMIMTHGLGRLFWTYA